MPHTQEQSRTQSAPEYASGGAALCGIPHNAALNQRIALRYVLDGMDRAETDAYIAHHLKLAGRTDRVFSEDAVALVHQVSRGLPRAVNNLATQALVAAYASNKSIVDESSARAAASEVDAE